MDQEAKEQAEEIVRAINNLRNAVENLTATVAGKNEFTISTVINRVAIALEDAFQDQSKSINVRVI